MIEVTGLWSTGDMTATTAADRARAYRERHGARVGGPPGPAPSAPCPSVAAYKRHRRHGEKPCDGCMAKWREYSTPLQRERRRRLREAAAKAAAKKGKRKNSGRPPR